MVRNIARSLNQLNLLFSACPKFIFYREAPPLYESRDGEIADEKPQ